MQYMQETGDALDRAKVVIRATQFIGSGHMDHTQPMRDIVVLTLHDKLPTELPGFVKQPEPRNWWRADDGRSVFFTTTREEFERWELAADTVRALHLDGVTMTRERRILVYRAICGY